MTVELWHYTCTDRAALIDRDGQLKAYPCPALPDAPRLLWLTDLHPPVRGALGLTRETLRCDRMAVAYRVDAPDAEPWLRWLRRQGRDTRRAGRDLPGLPQHWYVTQSASVLL